MPTVRDAMTEDVVVVGPDEPLERVLRTFASESIHGVPVVEGGRLIGIVTSVDVVRALASGEWRELTAGDVTRKAVTVDPDEDLETALDLMAAVGEDARWWSRTGRSSA